MQNSQYLSSKVKEIKELNDKIQMLSEEQLSIYLDVREWLNGFVLGNILAMGEIKAAQFEVVPHGENPTDLYFRLDSEVKDSLVRDFKEDRVDDLLHRIRDKLQGKVQECLEFLEVSAEDLEFFISLPEFGTDETGE